MGYNYGYDTVGSSFNLGNEAMGSAVWAGISLILALVGCFLVYFLFVNKDTKLDNKFLNWLRAFLRFDKMLIETILKICYIFFALFITLSSFGMIGSSFLGFLLYLVIGNLLARVIYEASLIIIMIWKNTTEIKQTLKK